MNVVTNLASDGHALLNDLHEFSGFISAGGGGAVQQALARAENLIAGAEALVQKLETLAPLLGEMLSPADAAALTAGLAGAQAVLNDASQDATAVASALPSTTTGSTTTSSTTQYPSTSTTTPSK